MVVVNAELPIFKKIFMKNVEDKILPFRGALLAFPFVVRAIMPV